MQVQISLNDYCFSEKETIQTICLSEDMKNLYAINSNGNNVLIIKGKSDDYTPRSNTVIGNRINGNILSRSTIS